MSLSAPVGEMTSASASGFGVPAAVAIAPDHFTQMWNDAKARYKKDTGRNPEDAPFATELIACHSVDDIIHVLDTRENAFRAFRDHGKKFRKVIDPVFCVVKLFLETGAEVSNVVRLLAATLPELAKLTPMFE